MMFGSTMRYILLVSTALLCLGVGDTLRGAGTALRHRSGRGDREGAGRRHRPDREIGGGHRPGAEGAAGRDVPVRISARSVRPPAGALVAGPADRSRLHPQRIRHGRGGRPPRPDPDRLPRAGRGERLLRDHRRSQGLQGRRSKRPIRGAIWPCWRSTPPISRRSPSATRPN